MTPSPLICMAVLLALQAPGAQLADAADHVALDRLKWVQTLAVKDGDTERCSPPRFSEKELSGYFSRDASRVPQEGFAHRDGSICHAQGYAVRGDRQLLRWELNLLGTGTLTWADGRKEYFACDDCLKQ